MKIRDDVLLGQHSHVGMARTANEDFFGYYEPEEDREFDLKGRLVVVCDGMGGHNGGEIASRLAVKTIIEAYQEDASGDVINALRRAIERANQAVYEEASQPDHKDTLKGMGTTVTALVQRRDMAYFAQVGDSRAYLIRGDQIKQMTKDHSLVQQLVDEGLLEESEMENHPDKNVILRSLGVKPDVEVDISYAPIAPGDIYLLCSDGLSGLVSADEMRRHVNDGLEDPGRTCQQLVDLANGYGGHDNVTVQILRIKRTDTETTQSAPAETVTQSFTSDQVEASIAKARAEAGSVATVAPAAAAVATTAEVEAPSVSETQPTLPVPTLDPAPGREAGGGLLGPIAAAFALGALLGATLGWGVVSAVEEDAAERRAVEARARAEALADDLSADVEEEALGARVRQELSEGEEALGTGRFEDARAHFHAVVVLLEAGGGS